MSNLAVQIVVKLSELILQSRIDVKKDQFRKLDSLVKQIKSQGLHIYNGNIISLLDEILLQELFQLRKKIAQQIRTYVVLIKFSLTSKLTGVELDVQYWQIQLKAIKEVEIQVYSMLVGLLEEIIFFLNKRPLFAQYLKSKDLKKKYLLDYEICYQMKSKWNCNNLLFLPIIYQFDRTSQIVNLKIKCYFLPNLQNLPQKCIFEDVYKRKQYIKNEEESINERKVSLYTFYDNDLDFTFISSDNESFKYQKNLKEHEISAQQFTEQFQLLIISEEDKFIQNNQEHFSMLSNLQNIYFSQ